ncbi:MAG: winged helix-turn-helix domain-containing protein, partial [Solirubrobacteraceae bacterium]
KPCHPDELFARICAAVRARRAGRQAHGGPVTVGELELQRHRYAALAGGRDLELTRREFDVLALLVYAGDEVVERESIYRTVWGYEMARGDRSVDVFVRRLRRKLEHASPGWRYVHTHFGVGYSFRPERTAL